jgi:hypothetical protein
MSSASFCARLAACLILATVGSVLSSANAFAQQISTCSISAWVDDTDPNGLNVRAGPSSDAAIVGLLPYDESQMAAEMSITGSQDGWFRIDKAVLDDYTAAAPKVVFEGEGWVSGRLIGLLLNDADLHTAPSEDSPVVAHLFYEDPKGNVGGADSFGVDRLLACQGDWVEVEGTFFDMPLQGWATRTCANQVTTCP